MLRTAQVKAIASRRQRRAPSRAAGRSADDIDAHLRSAPAARERVGGDIAPAARADRRRHRGVLRARRTAPSACSAAIGDDPDDLVEIVMPEAPLKAAMTTYALNILGVSIVISLGYRGARLFRAEPAAGAADDAHHAQHGATSARIRRTPRASSCPPAAATRSAPPSTSCARCSVSSRACFCRRRGLAQLGLAVSKINHDLRGMLANAQLLSDRLTAIPDPDRAALCAQAHRLARPRDQLLQRHAPLRARRGGRAAARAAAA